MTAPGRPTPKIPIGPNHNGAEYHMTFPTGDAPDSYTIHVSTDPTFQVVDQWASGVKTAGISGRNVIAPYTGPAYTYGEIYYWRARGTSGPDTGSWSSAVNFSYDPGATAPDPYDIWAGIVLGALARPRHSSSLGAIWAEGSAVGAILSTEFRERWRLYDVAHPPTIDRVVEVMGISFAVDYLQGWSIEAVTHDVEVEAP